MSKPTYYELLKHPEWQKKRLAIMERAGFICEFCGEKEKTLNVHHGCYLKNRKPWEYPDGTLHCLCEECHIMADAAKADIHTILAYMPFDFMPEVYQILVQLRAIVCAKKRS